LHSGNFKIAFGTAMAAAALPLAPTDVRS